MNKDLIKWRFRYDCPSPYFVLNDANSKIMYFEMNMAQIQESASLFEVNVPEFKLLKQCRKELKLLKVCTVILSSKYYY